MGFLLNMLEGQLGLSEQDKAAIAPALPHLKNIVDAVDAEQSNLEALVPFMVKSAPWLTQILKDWHTLGPAISALLSDGHVDLGGAMSSVQDIQNNINNNPATIQTAKNMYKNLAPMIDTIQKEWPQVAPAVDIVNKALAHKNTTAGQLLEHIHAQQSRAPTMGSQTGLGAHADIVRGGGKAEDD